jgi:hypothetical protein
LRDTNGLRNVEEFKKIKEENPLLYSSVCRALQKYLTYPDSGISPKYLYPAGEMWNKLCLLSEMMNSVDPLIHGWRTIGIDDGYVEQIHGFDNPVGHKFVHHYGSPNMKEFIGKIMNAKKEDVPKFLNNKIFLMKCDKAIKERLK